MKHWLIKVHSEAAADHSLSIPQYIKSKTKSWCKRMVIGLEIGIPYRDLSVQDISEVCLFPVNFSGSGYPFVAKSPIERQSACDFELVL